MKGASIIIASEANPRNFINKFENDVSLCLARKIADKDRMIRS